ncbi:MAG: hypothetical protein QGF59_30455 [Pirellulaceae bacterium]|nr:hypothetical protein [Pirellulaceae bacterium]
MVIDLAGEVTTEPFTSRMGRLLEATTFCDPRIIELSQRRFEVVCRQRGESEKVKRRMPRRASPSPEYGRSDNVMFYFCTSEARVLHLAIGFLPADDLLNAAALAERLMRETQLEREADRQVLAVSNWHLTCAHGKHLLDFQRSCAGKRDVSGSTKAWSPQYVNHVVATASQVHKRELADRFANQLQGAMLEQAIARLGHHGEVRTSFAHLVLSEVPLVALDKLDRICFETVTGQPCLSITARRKALYGWYARSRLQHRPMMIVVDDQPFAAPPVNELAELLIWEPKSNAVRDRLTSFASVQVTPGELAALLQDAAISRVTLSRNSRNWLLFDRHGEYVTVVGNENGPRLRKAMDLACE